MEGNPIFKNPKSSSLSGTPESVTDTVDLEPTDTDCKNAHLFI